MSKAKGLIVFLIPPKETISGGILSIFSICEISRQHKNIHKSDVVLATYPGHDSYNRNTLFSNNEIIYSFGDIVKRGVPKSLQMHVPEYSSQYVFDRLQPYLRYLSAIPKLSINIVNQNIQLMESPLQTANWFRLTPIVTQTTAHKRYATQEMADKYDLPTSHLSIYVDPGQYTRTPYEQKQDLIVLSPDKSPQKAAIVKSMRNSLPNYRFITIQNMNYDEYKDLISQAKFTITFGEGFDNYFFETFFSGGVTFAVYNDEFFADNHFKKFDNTFSDYNEMLTNLSAVIRRLDNKPRYESVVKENFDRLEKLYSFANYNENIKKFYQGKFDYLPAELSAEKLMGSALEDRSAIITHKDQEINKLQNKIQRQATEHHETLLQTNKLIAEKDRQLNEMSQSASWKLTTPLRRLNSKRKQLG